MSPFELLLFGAACYVFGLVSGAVLIPWLADRGLLPAMARHHPVMVSWRPAARSARAATLLGFDQSPS